MLVFFDAQRHWPLAVLRPHLCLFQPSRMFHYGRPRRVERRLEHPRVVLVQRREIAQELAGSEQRFYLLACVAIIGEVIAYWIPGRVKLEKVRQLLLGQLEVEI